MTSPLPPSRPAADQFDTAYHAPVLVDEVVEMLRGASEVLDGTLGGGGHTEALLSAGVHRVTGIDRDPEARATARARLARFEQEGRFRAVAGNYAQVDELPELEGARFDAILLDLGISSHQVDDPARGFSFREGIPLDMRMGDDATLTAGELLDGAEEQELFRIFREYGDEPRAARLAREVVKRRATRPFRISDDLVGAIRGALGARSGPGDFARLFQAVRIAVNDEIGGLERALPRLRERLVPNGILAIISYHSGEDRLVKHTFREWSADCTCPPKQPMCTCRGHALGGLVTRRGIAATADEQARNPRARSAHLRAWRRAA